MVSQDNDILSSNRSLIVPLIGSGFMTITSLGAVYMLRIVVWPVANRQHFGSITSLLSVAAFISQQLAFLSLSEVLPCQSLGFLLSCCFFGRLALSSLYQTALPMCTAILFYFSSQHFLIFTENLILHWDENIHAFLHFIYLLTDLLIVFLLL